MPDPVISAIAAQLGRLNKGVPKKLSDAERQRRRDHITAMNKRREERKAERQCNGGNVYLDPEVTKEP